MPGAVIPGPEALRRSKTNAEARWPAEGPGAGRVRPLALARIDAPFKIAPGASAAAVGDFFALGLAVALGGLGHPLPAAARAAPRAADNPHLPVPARALTPQTIDAAFARALAAPPADGASSEDSAADGAAARARRRPGWAFRAAAGADLVILLPQSIEQWRDAKAGAHGAWIDPPPQAALEQDPSRFFLHLADAEQVFEALNSACARICAARERRGAPPPVFAAGVSPAPAAETGAGDDILCADEHAKAVLLAGARMLAARRADTAYLPVYETVRRSALHAAFEPDGRTVRPAMMRLLARRIHGALVRPAAPSERAAAAAPGRAGLLAAQARAMTGRLYDDAAAAALQRAARANPDAFGAHMRLAQILLRGGRAAEAAESLRDAGAAAPGTGALALAQGELGRAEFRAGRAAEAETALRAACDLRPADASVRLHLGRALLALGRAAEAGAELRRACDLAPEDPAAYLELGRLLLESGDSAAAAAPLARAADLAPAEAAAHHKLGRAMLADGRRAEALGALRRAAELDPRAGAQESQAGIPPV